MRTGERPDRFGRQERTSARKKLSDTAKVRAAGAMQAKGERWFKRFCSTRSWMSNVFPVRRPTLRLSFLREACTNTLR
jgi:hypothetical protein